MDCITKFGMWSGQKVNQSKAKIMLTKHTYPDVAQVIIQESSPKKAPLDLKYLGLHLLVFVPKCLLFLKVLGGV